MAYEPDESTDYAALVSRAFCHNGEAYVPEQYFYGTRDEVSELARMGVFGSQIPRALYERTLAFMNWRPTEQGFEDLRRNYLDLGHSPNFEERSPLRAWEEPRDRAPLRSWEQVLTEQYHIVT